MNTNRDAPFVTDEFINIQIKRAFEGMITLRVENTGSFYAELRSNIYSYENHKKKYKGIRSQKASINIFTQLINRYQNFQVNDVFYFYNRGIWKWSNIKDHL